MHLSDSSALLNNRHDWSMRQLQEYFIAYTEISQICERFHIALLAVFDSAEYRPWDDARLIFCCQRQDSNSSGPRSSALISFGGWSSTARSAGSPTRGRRNGAGSEAFREGTEVCADPPALVLDGEEGFQSGTFDRWGRGWSIPIFIFILLFLNISIVSTKYINI